MAIGVDSIVRFKTFGLLRAQQMLNVWFYRVVSITPGSVVPFPNYLAKGFGMKWYLQSRVLVSSQYTYDRVEVDEVNGVDIGTWVHAAASIGNVVAECMPPQDAISVQLIRGNRTTRHGWKRFAGVPETFQSNGVVAAPQVAGWTSVMQEMLYPSSVPPVVAIDLVDPDDEIIGEVNLRAIIWGGNDPAFPTGRYQDVQGVDVKTEVSTQNTRKVGRGS